MSASCKYNCPFCNGESPKYEKWKYLTIGDLKEQLKLYQEAGCPHAEAMTYMNVINTILLDFPDSTLIIDIINIPELHILLGVCSKMLKLLEKICGQDQVSKFLIETNVTRDKGRSSLVGNDCLKLLTNIQKFENYSTDLTPSDSEKVKCVIDCLVSFRQV